MTTPTPEERAAEISTLRIFINDDAETYTYSDEKLTAYLSFYDDETSSKVKILKAAIMIITTVAQRYAQSVGMRIKINNVEKEVTADQSLAYNNLLNQLKDQLKALQKKLIVPIVYGGGIKKSEKKTAQEKEDSGLVPPIFEDGQFDFPPSDY